MPESPRLVDLLQSRITGFLDEKESELREISPELSELSTAAREFLAGGKRLRALFCYWGWAGVSLVVDETDPLAARGGLGEIQPVLDVAAALELLHAAALVHDDLMDNSDLRRGQPSVHRRFQELHTRSTWTGDGEGFGRASALLLGDALLGWSNELLDRGVAAVPPSARSAARGEFATMRTEVMMGQYLDMLEEVSWRTRPERELMDRAYRIVVSKSARYSVEAPLCVGAALAEGSLAQLASLRAVGLPLGVAFQLRDDLLGVFGDERVTGKPSGDDLREGKRTLLVTLARQKLPSTTLGIFDELVGDPELDPEQIAMLQSAVRGSGAPELIESLIARHLEEARKALHSAPITRGAREALLELADAAANRTS